MAHGTGASRTVLKRDSSRPVFSGFRVGTTPSGTHTDEMRIATPPAAPRACQADQKGPSTPLPWSHQENPVAGAEDQGDDQQTPDQRMGGHGGTHEDETHPEVLDSRLS